MKLIINRGSERLILAIKQMLKLKLNEERETTKKSCKEYSTGKIMAKFYFKKITNLKIS